MGLLTRQTREVLARWESEEDGASFVDFLDDVAEHGFEKACDSTDCDNRRLAQGVVARWIGMNDGRAEAYSAALRVRAEVIVHQGFGIVDNEATETARAKLRSAWRMQVAGHWSDRYRPRVQIDRTTAPVADETLLGMASDLLKLFAARTTERVVEPQDAEPVDAEPLALPMPAVREVRI